jgi:hypothetical protein
MGLWNADRGLKDSQSAFRKAVDMRCDEIRDRFVELLYSEPGTPGPSWELRTHVESCPDCRKELEDLKKVRVALRSWQDEPPIRPVLLPARAPKASFFRVPMWAKYAAVAAMTVLAFLAGFNSKVLSRDPDHYTRAEVRELIKQALYDSEARTSENMNVQLQKALGTIENEQGYMYTRLASAQTNRNRNKN